MESVIYSINSNLPALSLLERESFPYDRIYFGSESCESLIPKENELLSLIEKGLEIGIETSFVTPYNVNDMNLDRLNIIFESLESFGPPIEVVFNDWGVLEILLKRRNLVPVLGRALNRMKRDPRYFQQKHKDSELKILRTSNLTNKTYLKHLLSQGVNRIEFDNVPQGIELKIPKVNIKTSIYYPMIAVAFLKNCIFGATHQYGKDKYIVNRLCKKECLDYMIFTNNAKVIIAQKGTYMLNKSTKHIDLSSFDRIISVIL